MGYLSISRVKGLEQFLKAPLTAEQLGQILWPGHKMAKVNAGAIVRELLLGDYIEIPSKPDFGAASGPTGLHSPTSWSGPIGPDGPRYRATPKAAAIVANPPWMCRYCTLDIMGTRRRLQRFPCETCTEIHQVCRRCRKHLIRPTGNFPYVVKVRTCPGRIEIPKEPERKKKDRPTAAPRPYATQTELQFEAGPGRG